MHRFSVEVKRRLISQPHPFEVKAVNETDARALALKEAKKFDWDMEFQTAEYEVEFVNEDEDEDE